MSRSEHLELFYPKLHRSNFIESRRMIEEAMRDSLDEEGQIKDHIKFKFAYKLCESIYNDLKEYEDQIEEDMKEINGDYGSCQICYNDDYGIQQIQIMSDICEIYHKYFEHFDDSMFDKKQQKIAESNKEGNKANGMEEIILVPDINPEHREWFVKILNSKIPDKEDYNGLINKDKDLILYNCLERLYDVLCDLGCINPNIEDKSIFIYRFSGLNGEYPTERKILWKDQDILLGYIARCLLSDKRNVPMYFSTVTTFFYKENGKPMNLATATNCTVEDFEEEKRKKLLPLSFIKAVELLRKCGFINVEFTSKRR